MASDGLPPWRVLSSRVVMSDPWLTLRADTCETVEGARIDPFYVIETADVVAVIAISTDDQLVLVRQYRHGYGATTLEIPAGRVDQDEDPVKAGLRELGEETGYRGGHARVLRTYSPNTLRYANRVHVVLVEGVSLGVDRQDDPRERIEVVTWPLARAGDLLIEPEFANAVLAGALATGLAAIDR
jgi:8-oxo-dGTP pyrophosphatase MutT (NUDIX family)